MADDPTTLPDPDASDAERAAASRPYLGVRGVRARAEPMPQASPAEDADVLPSDREAAAEGDIGLAERARLNRVNAYYRGTLAGSAGLTAMAHQVTTPDDETTPPQMKRARNEIRDGYNRTVADLARYDLMKPWGTTAEGAAALGGGLAGTIVSPESMVGWAGKGATWLGRTVYAAFQQGMIQAAVDPIVQWLNNESGTEKGYHWERTAMAGAFGAIIGGGMHGVGELISNAGVRGIRSRMAKDDPQMRGAIEAEGGGDIVPERLPSDEAPTINLDQHSGETVIDINGKRTVIRNGEVVGGEFPLTPALARKAVYDDIQARLTDAGRDPAQAAVNAEIMSARYAARASRLEGDGGNAFELYQREGLQIRGPGGEEISGRAFEQAPGPADAFRPIYDQITEKQGGIGTVFIGDIIKASGLPKDVVHEALIESAKRGEVTLHQSSTAEGRMTPEQLDGVMQVGERKIATVVYKPREFNQSLPQAPPFYSAVERAITESKQEKASPDQWLGMLKNRPGVKPEEMEWLGLQDWLKEQRGSVSKQEIADYVRANAIEVREVTKGEPAKGLPPGYTTLETPNGWAIRAPEGAWVVHGYPTIEEATRVFLKARPDLGSQTKFGPDKAPDLTLPGGENYREMLLTLPRNEQQRAAIDRQMDELIRGIPGGLDATWRQRATPEQRAEFDRLARATETPPNDYLGSHWDEPNVLAHVRFNDRIIDGKKTLFLEEIQSDWHQAGKRQGYGQQGAWKIVAKDETSGMGIPYRSEEEAAAALTAMHENLQNTHKLKFYPNEKVHGVPDAPFKTTWPELALKRMIRYASEHGYDKIAWTRGETQAERYDLSKQVDDIQWGKRADGNYDLKIHPKDGSAAIEREGLTPNDLVETIGKDATDKIAGGAGAYLREHRGDYAEAGVLSGVDLKVGGEGMAGFYDKMLPAAANKLTKKFGGRVGQNELKHIDQTDRDVPFTVRDREGVVVETNIHDENHAMERAREIGGTHGFDETMGETRTDRIHTLDITPSLRDAATSEGFPLFQRGAGAEEPRGRITLQSNKAVIDLFAKSDASTFMHEAGHLWLDELIRDAAHAKDGSQLRSDMDAVLTWLKAESPDKLTTEQHEQWARGFETYLAEGTAPSSALAKAFEQFKQWLLAIYRSLSELKAPLSDDVRGVMDRLLATEQEIGARAAHNAPEPEGMVTTAMGGARKGPAARNPETFSLLEFLASRGGIAADDPLIGDVRGLIGRDNVFVPGFGPLIRKGGRPLDESREAAVGAGYIFDAGAKAGGEAHTTVHTLLDRMESELRGEKQYREGYEPPADRGKMLDEMERHLDNELEDAGVPTSSVEGKLRKRILQMMEKEHVADPLEAYERAVLEQTQRHGDRRAAERIPDEIPGWDVSHEPGAAPAAGRAAEEISGPGGGWPGAAPRAAGIGDRAEAGILAVRAAPEGPAGAPSDTLALAARAGGATLPMERARPAGGIPGPTVASAGTAAATPGTAVAAVPGAPSPAQEVALMSLQQQTMALADAIGFPLRQGRIKGQDVLGTFNQRSGVVRAREITDLEAVAHEAGHSIEAQIGQELTDLTDNFASELAPLVSNPAAYDPAMWVKEGFAEWIRRYIGNPAHAQQIAPGFAAEFRNFMQQRHPELLDILDSAAAAYQKYLEAPSADVIGAVRRSKADHPEGWRAVTAQIREDGFFPSVQMVIQKSYDAVLDQFAPVPRAMREVARAIIENEGTDLVKLKAVDNPEIRLRMLGRSQQAAVLDAMHGVQRYGSVTREGPSMRDAMVKAMGDSSVWGSWDEVKRANFADYLIARRASVLWEKFERGDLPRPPAAFSKADAVTAMAEFERAHPTFREGSDMVHGYTRELLRKMYEGGLIDQGLHDKLAAEPFYVPFMRDMTDKPMAGGGTGSSAEGPGMTAVVKKMQGSSRDIIDPIESILTQTFLVNRTIRHNDVIKAFVNYFGRAGIAGGRYVEKLPSHEAKLYTFDLGAAIERKAKDIGMSMDDAKLLSGAMSDLAGEDPLMGSFFKMEPAAKRGEPLVFYKDGGELKVARFMSEGEGHALYELVTALPSGLSDIASQMLATSAGLLRTGITTNPAFMISNFIRDQVATGILRSDYIPFYHGIKGISSELRQDLSAELYGAAGGVAAGAHIAPLEQAGQMSVDALKRSGYLSHRLQDLHGLLELASVSEAGTRNSIFKTVYDAKRAQGLSDYEAMWEAAWQAQDILDFSRWGSKTQAVRALTPFFNAHIQGVDKARRTLIDPIVRRAIGGELLEGDREAYRNAIGAWVKLLGVGGVLGAAWAAIHQDDRYYRDAPAELVATHWVTSIGGNMVVIPKPFELSLGVTAGEYAYRRLMQDDPRAAHQFTEAAWEVLKPPAPIFDNPLIKTTYEIGTGKSTYPSFFGGRDIVPDTLKGLIPAEQYTDRTSNMAKQIGRLIGVSPMKVDYAIGGYFGNWGRDALLLSNAFEEDRPTGKWADAAIVRRFIKDPTRVSDVTSQFWTYMARSTGEYNRAANTYDELIKRRSARADQEAQAYLGSLSAGQRAYVTMKSAADEDGRPAFKADQKRLHPLQRAYDAVTVLNGMRREMDKNSFAPYATNEGIKISEENRGRIRDNIRELGQMEMLNALVITRTAGYANRALLDTYPTLEKIRHISPVVADDIATRYATAKIYSTQAVANAYPKMESELNRYGSSADLESLALDAQADGYEFGGERVRRPAKRRVVVPPIGAAVGAP